MEWPSYFHISFFVQYRRQTLKSVDLYSHNKQNGTIRGKES
jgi:hypothetical protein